MKLFVDVNVFIDIQRKREGWKASFAIIESVVNGRNQGYISALTPAIIYFLRRQVASEAKARRETLNIIKGFEMVTLADKLINEAFDEKRIESFEDAIQFCSAKGKVEVFITRNKRDYDKVAEELEVLTPGEFLKKY